MFFGSSLMLAVLMTSDFFCASQSAPPPSSSTVQSAEPRIVAPSLDYHFPNGKNFVYAVEWHLFNAGTATMRLDPEGDEEKLTATAKSAGAVNLIYPVHSWFDARINPKEFCSTRVFKHSEEGKHKKETQIQFDSVRGKSVLDEKNLKNGETRHEEDDTPSCTTDILSGFFYLGSLPLLPESVDTFPVADGGKTTIVQARVEARERVKVPAGDFQAIRVLLDPLSGKFQGKGQIWVWYSDDSERTPIQMKAKLPWGTVMFKLQRTDK